MTKNDPCCLYESGGDYDDDYLIIDCPGQIELYSHFTIMKDLVSFLQRAGYQVCGKSFNVFSYRESNSKIMIFLVCLFRYPIINILQLFM